MDTVKLEIYVLFHTLNFHSWIELREKHILKFIYNLLATFISYKSMKTLNN